MQAGSSSEIVLSIYAEYKNGLISRWDKCIIQLTKRYLQLLSVDGQQIIGKFPIPDILSHAVQNTISDHPNPIKISCTSGSFLLWIGDENNMKLFDSYLNSICKTSAHVRMRTREMIFASNTMDDESADSVFVDILSSLFSCNNPNDLKHLLGKVKDYQNDTDISIVTLQKQYYLNFLECLQYLSEDLVTGDMMQYANDLLKGFDDNSDEPLVAEELLPQRVNIRDMFIGEHMLGKGKYGTVYVGCIRGQQEQVALKRIVKASMNVEDIKSVMKEASILFKLRRHPHIVGLRYFWEDDHHFYLIEDLMRGGELFEAIVQNGSFSEAQAQKCVLTILYTLDYCHQRGIVHRDLKPENLLLAEKGKLDSVKIADFGLSNQLGLSNTLKSYCGTPGYIAPEIAKKEAYGPAVDMWSLGVIAYILLCGYHPFPQDNDQKMFYNVVHGVFSFDRENWNDKSDDAKDFITRLLCVDPSKRMTARQAITHRWMMFESKSTMSMNRAVQELERFNARKTAHTVNIQVARNAGLSIQNYVAMNDCLVYVNPTLSMSPRFSMPRGTEFSVDRVIYSADGVWIHVFNNQKEGSEDDNNPKWVLAGKKNDDPICVPSNKAIYLSRFKKGRTYHLIKKSPTRDEPIRMKIPGGYAVIADDLITTNEGTWIVVNAQSLFQFSVTADGPMYLCATLAENILFERIL